MILGIYGWTTEVKNVKSESLQIIYNLKNEFNLEL